MMAISTTAQTMTTAIVGSANDPSGSQQSLSSTGASTTPSLPSWLPEMADIRAAHLAQASALESVVAILASKQQSSMLALKRQVDAMALAQRKVLRTVEQQEVTATKVAEFTSAEQRNASSRASRATGEDIASDETVGAESALAMEEVDTELEKDIIGPAPSWDTRDYQSFQRSNEQHLQQGGLSPLELLIYGTSVVAIACLLRIATSCL